MMVEFPLLIKFSRFPLRREKGRKNTNSGDKNRTHVFRTFTSRCAGYLLEDDSVRRRGEYKQKINLKKKLSPLPCEAGECSLLGSRRPSHPHSTLWSCEKGKTQLTTHIMQDSTLCLRQYFHAPLLCREALCFGFLTNQANTLLTPRFKGVRVFGQHGWPLMLPLRRYRVKPKAGLTRGKRSGQTRS